MRTGNRDDGTRHADLFGDTERGGHEDGREGRHADDTMPCDSVSRHAAAFEAQGDAPQLQPAPFNNVENLLAQGITPTGRVLLEKYGPSLTAPQVGEVLHRHPSHVRALCQQGELPAVRIGSRWHVPAVKLGALLDGGAEW